jgi:hypothetical protein
LSPGRRVVPARVLDYPEEILVGDHHHVVFSVDGNRAERRIRILEVAYRLPVDHPGARVSLIRGAGPGGYLLGCLRRGFCSRRCGRKHTRGCLWRHRAYEVAAFRLRQTLHRVDRGGETRRLHALHPAYLHTGVGQLLERHNPIGADDASARRHDATARPDQSRCRGSGAYDEIASPGLQRHLSVSLGRRCGEYTESPVT